MSETITYLNLGCGSRYHPDWINIDVVPKGPDVIRYELSRGIPLSDLSVDVVYHSAVLEHMRREDAVAFMAECFRVLKSGGIVRVGVPDLEKICQLYLSMLVGAISGEEAARHDYDWIMLELFDQTVREKSGGEMVDYLRQNSLPNEKFVYERIGEEGRQLVEALRRRDRVIKNAEQNSVPTYNILKKLRNGVRTLQNTAKGQLLCWLFGAEAMRALDIGHFRLAGEVHHWMYDRYSLARLLSLIGFHDPQLQDAKNSRIPNWMNFNLDTLPDGSVIKPDLFFMEAIKPGAGSHD